jgi:hypothetical protein
MFSQHTPVTEVFRSVPALLLLSGFSYDIFYSEIKVARKRQNINLSKVILKQTICSITSACNICLLFRECFSPILQEAEDNVKLHTRRVHGGLGAMEAHILRLTSVIGLC